MTTYRGIPTIQEISRYVAGEPADNYSGLDADDARLQEQLASHRDIAVSTIATCIGIDVPNVEPLNAQGEANEIAEEVREFKAQGYQDIISIDPFHEITTLETLNGETWEAVEYEVVTGAVPSRRLRLLERVLPRVRATARYGYAPDRIPSEIAWAIVLQATHQYLSSNSLIQSAGIATADAMIFHIPMPVKQIVKKFKRGDLRVI